MFQSFLRRDGEEVGKPYSNATYNGQYVGVSTPFEKPPQVKPQLPRTPDQTKKSFEGQNKEFIEVAEDRAKVPAANPAAKRNR